MNSKTIWEIITQFGKAQIDQGQASIMSQISALEIKTPSEIPQILSKLDTLLNKLLEISKPLDDPAKLTIFIKIMAIARQSSTWKP